MFTKKFLHPRGRPTPWRLIGWAESKSSTPYVDLEFDLLSEPRIRQVFVFPKTSSTVWQRSHLLDMTSCLTR